MVLVVSSEDRVIVVTGASEGLGLEWVNQYSKEPNTFIVAVVKTFSYDLTKLVRERKNISMIVNVDFLDYADFSTVAEDIVKVTRGRVDLLVNIAGTILSNDRDRSGHGSKEWHRMYSLATISPVRFTLALLPLLRHGKDKKIAIVDSSGLTKGAKGTYTHSTYSASYGALSIAVAEVHSEHRGEGFTFIISSPAGDSSDLSGHELRQSSFNIVETIAFQKAWIDNVLPDKSGTLYSLDGSENHLVV